MDWKQKILVSPLYDWFGKRSYAQSGEDLIAWNELNGQARGPAPTKTGFYVDVGCYHPKLFSNTYLFYKKGWRGICVDPNPKIGELYKKARPRDVFVNCGVGGVRLPRFGVPKLAMTKETLEIGDQLGGKRKQGMMEYFMFEDGAANTFSPEQAQKNQTEAGRKLIGKRMVAVLPLKEIFEKYLPKGKQIDLLSVDVEGMDIEVLKSNDWKKYRPQMVICEDLEFDWKNWMKSVVAAYLDSQGYELKAKTPYSMIFKRKMVE